MQAINNITNDQAGISCPPNVLVRSLRHLTLMLAALLIAALLIQPASAAAAAQISPSHNSSSFTSPVVVADSPLHLGDLLRAAGDQSVQGGFLQTYQRYGLSLIGYPLTPEMIEGGTTVQYFERMKMEYHPELASAGTPVLLTRLGAQISAGSPFGTVKAFSTTRAKSYFSATGHSLAEPFLSFWRNNGNVSLFGYPISEPIHQDGMLVQWFERARMEYHPELAAKGQPILLTHLGRIALSRSNPQSAPHAPAAPPTGPSLNGMESNLLAGINAQRSAAGAPPVAVTSQLSDFAHWRSVDMASHNFFAHSTSSGRGSLDALRDRGIGFALAGEILEKNNFAESDAVSAAVNDLLNSPAHRVIMLDARYTQVGVGFADGGDGMHYFTAVFIRK